VSEASIHLYSLRLALLAVLPVCFLRSVADLFSGTFGVLVGFILLCITVPAPTTWFFLHNAKAKEKLPFLHDDLAQAESKTTEIDAKLEKAEETLSVIRPKWKTAYKQYEQLERIESLKASYWKARSEYDGLQRAAQGEQWRLLHTDWRSLRGVDFENFLEQVFQPLGYTVQTTKATGDQGIDLILTPPGRRIGIQAKGWIGSVGNSAVQQAFTGRVIYGCDSCAVITNSDFTAAAREAAGKVGCTLICGGQIPDLISGKVQL